MAALRWLNLIFAILATTAPVAHVLELPNKLALDGPLWLAVQQHLYRGWGPMLGGPAETGSLATTLALLVHRRRNRRTRVLTLAASLAYASMIAVFLALNASVNAAVSHWIGRRRRFPRTGRPSGCNGRRATRSPPSSPRSDWRRWCGRG